MEASLQPTIWKHCRRWLRSGKEACLTQELAAWDERRQHSMLHAHRTDADEVAAGRAVFACLLLPLNRDEKAHAICQMVALVQQGLHEACGVMASQGAVARHRGESRPDAFYQTDYPSGAA